MIRKEAMVKSVHGLHARPSCAISTFSQTLVDTRIKITNTLTDESADAKSILSLLALGIPTNAIVLVEADGRDEKKAVDEVCKIINEYEAD